MSELDAYDYELPPELIAQHPLPERDASRLLVVERRTGELSHRSIRDLPGLLAPPDVLVLNDTKVLPARLVGTRARTGGRWTGLFLQADERGVWRVLAKTRGQPQVGETITLLDREGREAAGLRLLAKLGEGEWAVLPDPPLPPPELLERVGRTPLPHYIRSGESEPDDWERYQTVFAAHAGSVAAPTAGLHFTPELLAAIAARGVTLVRITLHVGVGTFRPIAVDRLDEHRMHAEWRRVDEAAAAAIRERRAAGGRAVAVGTTVVRSLESAAPEGELQAASGSTDLFLRPGHQFRAVDALLTNFHLPRSTLLVLVRAFGGDELLKRAYAEAVRERYRFFSYGDAMLIV